MLHKHKQPKLLPTAFWGPEWFLEEEDRKERKVKNTFPSYC